MATDLAASWSHRPRARARCSPESRARPSPRERRQPGNGAREHTVHQERYNTLKIGYEPQEASAKVRKDFGVLSVTCLAWSAVPGLGRRARMRTLSGYRGC